MLYIARITVTRGWPALVQGGVTPIGAVSRAATGVKMQSNGQGTFWGSVKRSSGVLGPISGIRGGRTRLTFG